MNEESLNEKVIRLLREAAEALETLSDEETDYHGQLILKLRETANEVDKY